MMPPALYIPLPLWQATFVALAPYHTRRVEGGCFWYGRREDGSSGISRAVLLGIPKQINRPLNFEIPSDSLAELNANIPENLTVVAQIHSHPGEDTNHSGWDDTMIVSRRIFSLVLPNYAATPRELAAVGVHAYESGQWLMLSTEECRQRLVFDLVATDGADVPKVDMRGVGGFR